MGAPKRITIDWLEETGACSTEDFERVFGEWADLTRANLSTAAAEGLDIEWFADHLFRFFYSEQLADYEAKRAPIGADYRAKLAPIDADYRAKRAPIGADYEAKRAMILADVLGLGE